MHCVKSAQIRSFFWSECGKIQTRKTPYLDTFHAVMGKLYGLQAKPNSTPELKTKIVSIICERELCGITSVKENYYKKFV